MDFWDPSHRRKRLSSILHGYSRSSTPLKISEPKDKDPLEAMKDAYEKQMIEMKREMKKNMEEAE